MTGPTHLRELPDGGFEFVLEDPVLTCLVVDDRVTLRFGRTDVVVADRFELEVDGVHHHLDPRRPETLAPLLATYPGAARWLHATPGASSRWCSCRVSGWSSRPRPPQRLDCRAGRAPGDVTPGRGSGCDADVRVSR